MPIRNSRFAIRALLLLLVPAAGCGKLSENAQHSADNSLRAADATEMVLQNTQNAYGDGRQAHSRTRRLEEITRLEQAQTLDGKLVAAAAYFYAYEFQLWKQTGSKEDTDAKRQVLFAEGVGEFLKTARDYQSGPADAAALGENLNFLALALGMHQLNTRQIAAGQVYKFQPRSMLDLLEEGLSVRGEVNGGRTPLDRLSPYQLDVLKEEGVAVHLLQARRNGLVGSVVRSVFRAETELANLAMVQANVERLEWARKTRQVLATAGAGVKPLPSSPESMQALTTAMGKLGAEASAEAKGLVAEELRKKKLAELLSLLGAELRGQSPQAE